MDETGAQRVRLRIDDTSVGFGKLVTVLAEQRHTLATRAKLARYVARAGDRAGSTDLLAGLLPAIERVLGPDNPHTLTARHQLASFTGQAGLHDASTTAIREELEHWTRNAERRSP